MQIDPKLMSVVGACGGVSLPEKYRNVTISYTPISHLVFADLKNRYQDQINYKKKGRKTVRVVPTSGLLENSNPDHKNTSAISALNATVIFSDCIPTDTINYPASILEVIQSIIGEVASNKLNALQLLSFEAHLRRQYKKDFKDRKRKSLEKRLRHKARVFLKIKIRKLIVRNIKSTYRRVVNVLFKNMDDNSGEDAYQFKLNGNHFPTLIYQHAIIRRKHSQSNRYVTCFSKIQ